MSQKQLSTVASIPESLQVLSRDDVALAGVTQWKDWLAEQQSITLAVYSIKPAQIIADRRREQGISRDYKGREILELLQNATDAAKKAGHRGRIRIELSTQGLIVANTGVGFTTGGVRSLQTADLSPKRSKNSQLIGSKGLGFRSVLNWSRHPIVLSGALQIAFSSRYALGLVDQLRQKYRAVGSELKNHEGKDSIKAPLLPFPVDLNITGQQEYIDDVCLFESCQYLREQAYDTVIGMPFDREYSYDNALNQLNQLRPEFLLFSDSIESLSISVKAESTKECWDKQWSSTIVSEGVVDLTEQKTNNMETSSQRWQLFSQMGDIPTELLSDSDDPDSYHLVVAIKEEGLAKPASLYSFFPTSISLPLHFLCHASLELEQNRKYLQESKTNDFVLRQLAMLVADTVEKQADASEDVYRAVDLLAPASIVHNFHSDIKPFQQALVEAVKHRKLIPVLSGNRLQVNDVQCFPKGITDLNWLPVSIFPHIALARNGIDNRFYDFLGMDTLQGGEFVDLLQATSDITLEQRANLALGIIHNRLSSDYCYKGLLLDTQGNELLEDDSVYLPGGSLRAGLVFPPWAKVKILNEQLWSLLRSKKVRGIAKALSVFDVHEYALSHLIAGLVSSGNTSAEVLDEHQVRIELLQSLFAIFKSYTNDELRPDFPKRLITCLLNQKGEWVSANELYFSVGYTPSGSIVSRLYQSVPEKLTASPLTYIDMGIDKISLSSFLAWLGVAEWPREIDSKNSSLGFLHFAKFRIKYPAVFIENTTHVFESPDRLPDNCYFEMVKSLDAIDEILASESDAILAWLANDPRTMLWLNFSETNGRLSFYPSRARNARIFQGELPSYIHWKIKYSLWLSCSEGKPLAPIDCMVNDAAVAGLFPRPVLPTKERMEELGLTTNLMKFAWLYAGVRERVEDFNSEEIYALLTELPKKDPAGNLAKKLYNWLIKTVDLELDEAGENYMAFAKTGKILAKYDDKFAYYPVAEAYHVDVEGFPLELLRSLPVACLLKKRGTEKVRRLFRVNVLDKESVNEKVIHHSAAVCTEQANRHFQAAKKFIEIFRHSQFAKAPGRSVFERLQLLVCDQVQSQITFNEVTIDNPLPPWTYSIQDDQLYVSCNPVNAGEPYNPLLSNTIGDAIASIFGLTDGDSFSKIYQCDEGSRAELLSKMLGDELDEDLDAMLQSLVEEAADRVISEPVVSMGPVPEPSHPTIHSAPPLKTKTQPATVDPSVTSTDWNVPSVIGVESVEHVPDVPGAIVNVRVSTGASGGSGTPGVNSPKSDGKVGESLSMLFEESQGRFPLYIGHITGYETIAADILSFRNADDREIFKSGRDQSAALVDRLIEAKEKWSGGLVKLTVNEVNTAAQWKDKYYIYRLTPIDTETSEYELKMLNNPLAELEAVVSSIEISLDLATSSQQFRVFGQD